MEKPHILGTFGIIGSAIDIPFRNPSFITFTFITIFPLLCPMMVPRLPYNLQPNRVMEASFQLTMLFLNSNALISATGWVLEVAIQLLKEIVFHLLNFLIAVTVIYSASIIYTTGRSKRLRDLLQNPITKNSWCGPLLTFLYMSLVSNFLWDDAGPLSSVRNKYLQPLHFIIYVAAHMIWVQYIRLWNVGGVVLVLEEKRRFGGFATSSQLSRGNRVRGFVFMLLYTVWRLGLPTSLMRWSFVSGIAYYLVYRSLLCYGEVLN